MDPAPRTGWTSTWKPHAWPRRWIRTTPRPPSARGTLFEYLTLAAGRLGYRLEIALFPDGEYARSASPGELQHRRVAHLRLVPARPCRDALYDMMFLPDTARVPYQRGTLPGAQVRWLSRVDLPGLRVQYLGDEAQRQRLKPYLLRGARVEAGVPAVMREARCLFRRNEREKMRYRYGFSFEGAALPGWKMHLLQGLLTLCPGLDSPAAASRSLLDQTAMAVDANAGYFLILGEDRGRRTQFNAGRLFSRMLLKAHTLGLAVQPLTQAIEDYPAMGPVNGDLHRDFAHPGETILMLFRIGRPEGPVPHSMRMDVLDLCR